MNSLQDLTLIDFINLIANISQLMNNEKNASNNDIMRALELQNKKYLEEILYRMKKNENNSGNT